MVAKPAGLSFDSATPLQGTYDAVSGVWTPGALANGASATLMINAHVTGPAPIVNTAVRLVSDQVDPNGGNDAASEHGRDCDRRADRKLRQAGKPVTAGAAVGNAGAEQHEEARRKGDCVTAAGGG